MSILSVQRRDQRVRNLDCVGAGVVMDKYNPEKPKYARNCGRVLPAFQPSRVGHAFWTDSLGEVSDPKTTHLCMYMHVSDCWVST
jgi:hypothetical protein